MSETRTISTKQVQERERVRTLLPKESDFIGRKGFERYHVAEVGGERIKVRGEAPDGTYKWAYHFKPNDGHGKLTREAAEVGEMLKPFQRADVARAAGLPQPAIDPALAEAAARRNGRSQVRRGRGSSVERGVDGMLFQKRRRGEWEPLGVRCLGTPLFPVARLRSPQRDPDGVKWFRVGRKWVTE